MLSFALGRRPCVAHFNSGTKNSATDCKTLAWGCNRSGHNPATRKCSCKDIELSCQTKSRKTAQNTQAIATSLRSSLACNHVLTHCSCQIVQGEETRRSGFKKSRTLENFYASFCTSRKTLDSTRLELLDKLQDHPMKSARPEDNKNEHLYHRCHQI